MKLLFMVLLRDWPFFEEAEFQSSKGKRNWPYIGCKINETGFDCPIKRALDVPWHLTYPSVFEFGDDWYMLPRDGGDG